MAADLLVVQFDGERFIWRSGNLVAIASLCHPSRHAKFLNTPPAAIYGLDELVCYPNGNPSETAARTFMHRYCWVIWKAEHSGRPSFWWLSPSDFRQPH
jgi:hypothetical protein